jgi:hypothetical protein
VTEKKNYIREFRPSFGWVVSIETEVVAEETPWIKYMAALVSEFVAFAFVCENNLKRAFKHCSSWVSDFSLLEREGITHGTWHGVEP